MKALKFLRILAVLIGVVPIYLGSAPPACADLAETMAEEKAMQVKVNDLQMKVIEQNLRVEKNEGISPLSNSVLKDYRKQLAKAEKALQRLKEKVAKQRSEIAKDAAKDAVRDAGKTAAQHASRDAAMAAAKDAAKAGAKEAAKEASKTASKDSSKSSGQSAGHEAAKSAAHPPAPKMH